jgi:polyferredoxin
MENRGLESLISTLPEQFNILYKEIGDGIFLILPLIGLIILAPLISIQFRLGGWFKSVSLLLHNLLNRPRELIRVLM